LPEGTDFHYAKIYVTEVTGGFVTFWWAFQTDPGNPDLSPPAPGGGTGTLSSASPESKSPGMIAEATLLTNRFSDPPIVEREHGHGTLSSDIKPPIRALASEEGLCYPRRSAEGESEENECRTGAARGLHSPQILLYTTYTT
jgi:hypothetical protein